MDIKCYLPNKKVRRSDRLVLKDKGKQSQDKHKQKDMDFNYPLGFFDTIPLELRFNIFQFLSSKSFGAFSFVPLREFVFLGLD